MNKKLIVFLIVLIMSIILSIAAIFVLKVFNTMKSVTDNISERGSYIYVYISDSAPEKEIKDFTKLIKSVNGVEEVKLVSKSEALEEAKDKLEDRSLLSQYTDTNHPFPAHINIKLISSKNREEVIHIIDNSDFQDIIINVR